MSYLDWKVGDKVVCVKRNGWMDAETGAPMGGAPHPKCGEICVIRDISISEFDGGVYVGIQGCDPTNRYDAKRFRPVQKRSTDISIFTAMLTSAKQKVPS